MAGGCGGACLHHCGPGSREKAGVWVCVEGGWGGVKTFTKDLLSPAGPHFPEAPQLPKRVLLAGKYAQSTSLWEAGQILHPNKRF